MIILHFFRLDENFPGDFRIFRHNFQCQFSESGRLKNDCGARLAVHEHELCLTDNRIENSGFQYRGTVLSPEPEIRSPRAVSAVFPLRSQSGRNTAESPPVSLSKSETLLVIASSNAPSRGESGNIPADGRGNYTAGGKPAEIVPAPPGCSPVSPSTAGAAKTGFSFRSTGKRSMRVAFRSS